MVLSERLKNVSVCLSVVVSGCVGLQTTAPDAFVDASAEIRVDIPNAPTCDIQREADRIMSNQVGVVDCGLLRIDAAAQQREAYGSCIEEALRNGVPVRATFWYQAHHGWSVQTVMSRTSNGVSDCVFLNTETTEALQPWVDAFRVQGPLMVRRSPADNTFALAYCAGFNIGEDAGVYDPPRVIPSARICPAQ